MKNKQPSDPSIQQLLDRLEQKPDDQVGRTTLVGRALSRSSNNVHLAISGGIVAVPISNIEMVSSLSASQPDAVRIVVKNPQEIQPLLRTRQGSVGGKGGVATIEASLDGETVYSDRTFRDYVGVGTCTFTETDTITGGQGQPDACDDSEADNCPADDLRQ